MNAWQTLMVLMGAGLASGREIAVNFAQFGLWGLVGLAAGLSVLYLLCGEMPANRACTLLSQSLLIATGGAMLAASAHVWALTLPVRHAEIIGAATTMAAAMLLARNAERGSAWITAALLVLMVMLILLGYALAPMRAVRVEPVKPVSSILRGFAWGGFNAALVSASGMHRGKRGACIALLALLIAAWLLLQRHSALMAEPMPFVKLAMRFGRGGYLLIAASIYLAALGTLAACIRGLRHGWEIAGIILLSFVGFAEAVGVVYPLLGAIGGVVLLISKMMKISRQGF